MSQTTHDINALKFAEEFTESDKKAPCSTGYASDDNYDHLNRRSKFDEVLECLVAARAAITPEQLAVINEVLSGTKPQN
jgi:hypothetical protein